MSEWEPSRILRDPDDLAHSEAREGLRREQAKAQPVVDQLEHLEQNVMGQLLDISNHIKAAAWLLVAMVTLILWRVW